MNFRVQKIIPLIMVVLAVAILSWGTISGKSIWDFFKLGAEIEESLPDGYYIFETNREIDEPMARSLKEDTRYGIRIIEKLSRRKFIGKGNPNYKKPLFISGWKEIREKTFGRDVDNLTLEDVALFGSTKQETNNCALSVVSLDPELNLTPRLKAMGYKEVVRTLGVSYVAVMSPCNLEKLKKDVKGFESENEVRWAYPVLTFVPTINYVRRMLGTDMVVQNMAYNGSGKTIGIWDVGRSSDPREYCHEDFCKRVSRGDSGFKSDKIFRKFGGDHPTQVTGVLIGDGSKSKNKIYRGIAISAKGISFQPLYADSEYLFAARHGLIDVATNSWLFGGRSSVYQAPSLNERVDMVSYLAGADVPIFWAAGNEAGGGQYVPRGCNQEGYFTKNSWGKDYYCIFGLPGAKNVITVGATYDPSWNNFWDEVTRYSSRGPVWDGRIKPDVVAPARLMTTTLYNNYSIFAGTSSATPVVAGHAILLQQALDDHEKKYGNPEYTLKGWRAALIKALLIHEAKDLGNKGPDYVYGYGRIQPNETIKRALKKGFILDSFDKYTKAPYEKFYPVKLPQKINKSLKITLVWQDYPGYSSNFDKWPDNPSILDMMDYRSELVNNLDLAVYYPGKGSALKQPFKLNHREPWAEATTGFNDKDNVEQIILTPEDLRGKLTNRDKHIYIKVTFRNYQDSPDVNQKFVVVIGEGEEGPNSYELTCGNKKLEPEYGEECEYLGYVGNRWDFGGKTCRDYAPNEPVLGKLECNAQCKIEDDNCYAPLCGDGVVQMGESCDPGDKSSFKVGCYGYKDGKDKACKQMCVTDTDCNQQIGLMRCEEGVCRGCGDGEPGVSEGCDPSSRKSVSVSCSEKFPHLKTTWSCPRCNCFARDEGTIYYLCKGKKSLSKDQCQKDSDCRRKHPTWRTAVCNDICRCEGKYRCPTDKKIYNRLECKKDSDCLKKHSSWKAAECLSNCSCEERFLCRGMKTDKKPQCQTDSDCPSGKFCDSSCACVPNMEPSPCGIRQDETGPFYCGGSCPNENEVCGPIYFENTSRGPGDPGLIKGCRCIPY